MEQKYPAAIPAVVTGIALGSFARNPFSFLYNLLVMLRFRWHLWFLWSFFVAAVRISDGFAAAMFDSPEHFSRREALE